jgi:beta-lactamase class A
MSGVFAVLLTSTHLIAAGLDLSALQTKFDRIVKSAHADVGVALIHVESGARLAINPDRRFPMASVYKLPIAIELLSQIGEGRLTVDQQISIGPSDIRACCTLSRRHPKGGVTLTAGELLELMITESDNTAGDAILKLVGGPAVVERRMRALGFNAINVNRYEGDIAFEMDGVVEPPPKEEWTLELQYRLLHDVPADALRTARARYTREDPRDTATPDDMARLLVQLQLGKLLPPAGTRWLLDLMARVKTGPHRLKALLPAGTIVAHKTGTTDVVINDVGLITLPEGSATPGHVALAVFLTDGRVAAMQQTIAQLSGAAFEFFTGKPLPKPEKRKAAKTKPPKKRKGRGPAAHLTV